MYSVSGLPPGANALAFLPMPPPVVTNPLSSSYGLVSRTIVAGLNAWTAAPAPASTGGDRGVAANPGEEPLAWKPVIYVGGPLPEYALPRNREELPIPAVNPNAPAAQPPTVASRRPRFTGRGQIAWPRAAQRWPAIGGSGG